MNRAISILTFVILFLSSPAAWAQSSANTGLEGVVLDPTGAAIADATVTLVRADTGETRELISDAAGRWEARFLSAGTYTIIASAGGFAPLEQEGVGVTTGVVGTVDLEMNVGRTAEAISVNADVEMVTRTSAAIALDLSPREIENLPTSSRNFTQLLLIEPGVTSDLVDPLSNKNSNVSPTVNGSRSTSNSLYYNGVDATSLLCCNSRVNGSRGTLDEGGGTLSRNIAPAPETLQEVKLQTSLYDASVGRNSGGNLTLVSKGGTNDLHGTLYHFLQNDKLIANDFFFNSAGLERQRLQRNEGGVTIGGPIAGNRTFFFGSYQYTRARSAFIDGASSTVRMPEALTNDRSDAGINAFASAIGVDPSDINPISRRLLQLQYEDGRYLIPSGAGGRNCEDDDAGSSCQLTNVIPSTYEQDQAGFSVDHLFTPSNTFRVRGFWVDQPSRDPLTSSDAGSLFEREEDTAQRVLSLVDTHVFGPTVITEFRLGAFRNVNHVLPVPYFTNAEVGIVNPLAGARPDLALIQIEPEDVGGDLTVGTPALKTLDVQNSFTGGNTTSVTSGNHFLKIGAEVRHHQLNGDLQEVKNLQYEFESWENFLTVGAGDDPEQIAGISLNYGETSRAFRMTDYSVFIADDWQVRPGLTLNLGLRYDFFAWPYEKQGRIANFDLERALAAGSLSAGYVFASNYQRGLLADETGLQLADSRSTLEADMQNFAPRFGFAWSPDFGNGMVIRGGYGIYFDRPTGAFTNSLRQSPPFFREQEGDDRGSYDDVPDDPPTYPIPDFQIGFDDGEPFLTTTDDPDEEFEALEAQVMDPNLQMPYYQHWNFGLQFPLTNNLLFDVAYVGSKGTKLLQSVNLNPPQDVGALGFLPRAGVPGGGFVGNYFETPGDEFVNTVSPGCDLFDDPDDCTIAAELRSAILGFDEDEDVNALVSSGNSNYHSLQTSLNQRVTRGVSYSLNYTWSKSIDTFSDEGIYQAEHDQSRLYLNRAVSDFDRPHRFIASYTWDLPFAGSRWVDGWSLSGIGTFQSGRPFSIVDDDFSGILYASTGPRPSLIDGARYDDLETSGDAASRVLGYINTGVLRSEGAQFGTLGRNVMRAPAQRRLDLSIRKVTVISESTSIEFRAEFYNLTNTSNFREPESDLSSGDFGEIDRTVGGPRVTQFALRLNF